MDTVRECSRQILSGCRGSNTELLENRNVGDERRFE